MSGEVRIRMSAEVRMIGKGQGEGRVRMRER